MDTTKFNEYLSMAMDWRFLNEPFWRWFVFIIALGAALAMWRGVLRHME